MIAVSASGPQTLTPGSWPLTQPHLDRWSRGTDFQKPRFTRAPARLTRSFVGSAPERNERSRASSDFPVWVHSRKLSTRNMNRGSVTTGDFYDDAAWLKPIAGLAMVGSDRLGGLRDNPATRGAGATTCRWKLRRLGADNSSAEAGAPPPAEPRRARQSSAAAVTRRRSPRHDRQPDGLP